MPNGDAAAAAGMDLVASTAKRKMGYDEINKSRDYTATKGVLRTEVQADPAVPEGGKIVRYQSNTRLAASAPIEDIDVANKYYVDGKLPGRITISAAAPSGGADGDLWFQV